MKKLITFLLVTMILLTGCNTKKKESSEVALTSEKPSNTLEVLAKSINDLDMKSAVNCVELSDEDKDVLNEKSEEVLGNPLFKTIFQTAVLTSVKEVKSEEIDGDKAKVVAIISIETIKNLGETAKNTLEKIIEEGTNYDESQLQNLVLTEISKIDISKKEIVDMKWTPSVGCPTSGVHFNIEMTFNMILDGDKWVISKNNGVEINDKSITITDKE